jgi:hypothetical protein
MMGFCSKKMGENRFAIEKARLLVLSDHMPDNESSISILLTILLPVLLLLVFVMFLIVIRIASRLRRIEQLLRENHSSSTESVPSQYEVGKRKKSEYEEFLREDGGRRMLSKREQSAAFRDWRRQRGKTWSPPDVAHD